MNRDPRAEEDRIALRLSLRDWLVVALGVTALLAIVPSVRLRPRSPALERDYRIPYALSARYEIFRRFTALSASKYPTILVGDSVVWGQCARRDDTLSHHLNELTKQPRFANAGLDGMHPVALAELLEHHAPAIERKDVILHFDPLWLMVSRDRPPPSGIEILFNRPDLVPRLAARFTSDLKEKISAAAASLVRSSPLSGWAERFSDSQVDFLAWSLDHPYENPLRVLSSALPPSEDSHILRLTPWSGADSARLDYGWPDLEDHEQWKAFERILSLLERRGNRVLVLVGPMNEDMMNPPMRIVYQRLKQSVREKLAARGVRFFMAPGLRTDWFSDICHPLGEGYAELARELLKAESAWLLQTSQPR